jgi:hypothetical protein
MEISWICPEYCSYTTACIGIRDILVLIGAVSLIYFTVAIIRCIFQQQKKRGGDK